ncbi:ATP-binding protein [Kitasatospora sp. GP82]|uniref:sensor histidine kinase n=1 Tax=Kitasatospora sp. GP82 TaxID=3035089 RepID=UPI002475D88B|nr:ATP-binding protein [Kitasatospora sp. GP82]MDH6127733.1 signal transduction histidine kinase [Kitasatospora sp. GP82]
MRARTRFYRVAQPRPNGRTVFWAVAGILVGAGAGVAAVVLASTAQRSAVAATVAGGLVLWSALVVVACRQAERSRRMREELTTARYELTDTRSKATALQSDLSATHAAAAALRTALTTAQTECESARAELAGARTALAEIRAEATALRERSESEIAALREQTEAADRDRADLDRLSCEVLPEVVSRLRSGSSVDSVLAPHAALPHAGLLRTVAEEVGRGERQRAAALAVCATAAGRVQALATSMHAELREMQHQHGEDVLGDLLGLDHSTAQIGRMADGIAVLTGARSGRRWTKPIGVESILRGALGRIGAYQRVRLHSASTAAVAGFAAEGVMHALAELLDNAANFSAPPAEVHVYVEEVHSGLVITVEDGGLGLSESWLRRAEQAVSAAPLDLTTLSAGTRLGLAVVGSLARKHGLSISFRPSARGGTGVVMLIPERLVTHPTPAVSRALAAARTGAPEAPQGRGEHLRAGNVRAEQARPEQLRAERVRPALEPSRSRSGLSPAVRPEPGRTEPGTARTAGEAEPATAAGPATGAGGLPQRRRGQTLAAAQPSAPARTSAQPSAPALSAQPVRADAAVSAARFGAFRKALQQGPATTDALPKDDSR